MLTAGTRSHAARHKRKGTDSQNIVLQARALLAKWPSMTISFSKHIAFTFTKILSVESQCHLDNDCFIVRNSYTADKHFVYLLYFYLITLLT